MELKSIIKNVGFALVLLMFLVLATSPPVRAYKLWIESTAHVEGEEVSVLGGYHWGKGITIKVYIPNDPDGQNRHEEVKKAFEEWERKLDANTTANINFEYHVGETAPAEDPDDRVIAVDWVDHMDAKGSCESKYFLEPTEKKDVYKRGANYRSDIKIARYANDELWDADTIYNIALHEIGHSLGLDHYTPKQLEKMKYGEGVMTDRAAETGRTIFHEEDIKGIQEIYGARQTGSEEIQQIYAYNSTGMPVGDVNSSVIQQETYYIYNYEVTWLSGAQISAFEITTNGVNISDVQMPVDWLMANYSYGDGVLLFYADANYLDYNNSIGNFSFKASRGPALAIWWAGTFGTAEGPSAPFNVFNITWEGATYYVTTFSNSTVTDFNFSQPHSLMSFNVSGPDGTVGFCNVTIPEDLLWGEFSVYMDGNALVKDVDYTQIYNGTHYIFYITYTHPTHLIEIRGTEVIPEIPKLASTLLLLIVVTSYIVIYKQRHFLNSERP